LGSLALSIALELRACPLCFYQRSFAMAALGALVLGLLVPGPGSRPTALATALLCAAAGLGVAVFHVSLEARGTLECPEGLLGIGSAPVQSLAALAVLFVLVALGAFTGPGRRAGVVALILGAVLSIASIWSSPPLPPTPKAPYTAPLDICRPPYAP
jgi:disulfide bond formation protein DsbB